MNIKCIFFQSGVLFVASVSYCDTYAAHSSSSLTSAGSSSLVLPEPPKLAECRYSEASSFCALAMSAKAVGVVTLGLPLVSWTRVALEGLSLCSSFFASLAGWVSVLATFYSSAFFSSVAFLATSLNSAVFSSAFFCDSSAFLAADFCTCSFFSSA